ncbi:transcription activator GutR [Nonlabens ulvanivorans]|nr:NB-ARC domain-containing protein [Nonlabens ulvanivorans]GAK91099.1 transcription activator GutR [Nonlabens ulvanivorans]
MSELYSLRCKIAHIKGFFTSIDLDKLIELANDISIVFNDNSFSEFIKTINEEPEKVIIKIPSDFIEDYLESNGIVNNLPIPDYDYEGGFVGRLEDKKKIKKYLQSEKFPVITITGAGGGVGKTSLALKIIQETTQSKEKIFDSIIWLSAKENRLTALGIEDIEPTLKSYEELLDTFIEIFSFEDDLENDSIESKEELTNTIIDLNSKILVVIDNLETITDERIINFILDAPLKVKFLVTSRKGIGQVERRHELKELKAKEAIYLFRQLAKDKQMNHLSKLKDGVILKYVEKVSFYPLAIKWVLGQVARGKDINRIINSINSEESDISKFCFEQIFLTLSENCKKVLFTITCMETPPTVSILKHITELDENTFEDTIEELILASLIIPEQYQDKSQEIATKYTLLPLTKGFVRLQLNKDSALKNQLNNRIIDVESTISESQRAKKEYKHSLHNFGAKTDEEKIATIISQSAFQKYQNGNYDLAVEEYKRAIKMAPNFSPVYRNWGVLWSLMKIILKRQLN